MTQIGSFMKTADARTHYTAAPTHESPFEGCYGFFVEEPSVQYVFVGKGRGRYEQSQRGNYHFVGRNKGHFEKEEMPMETPCWKRTLGMLCCLLTTLLLVTLVWNIGGGGYDCKGLEDDWTSTEKQYCCEKMGIGCVVDDSDLDFSEGSGWDTVPEAAKPPPHWLNVWLADLSIASKFVLTMALVAAIGCCCGLCITHRTIKSVLPPTRSPTQDEILKEMDKLLHRYNAKEGEITVTMMWDTKDDLDLAVELPNEKGTICAETPEVASGKLDVDGNICMQRPNSKNIEHIYFAHYTRPESDHFDMIDKAGTGVITRQEWEAAVHRGGGLARLSPPAGEYHVWCKVTDRDEHAVDVYVTIVVNILGKREVFHHRIVPGQTEAWMCRFNYDPRDHIRSHHANDHLSAPISYDQAHDGQPMF